ncbi:peptidase M16 domain-containing protein [Nitritalea halalkaliphila LW7]|uniref:Peptidase M16 domain-containing protein n=1 Tax=Nitritalea halalkaliphila LW7 TaxID=1189621 RepID=I5C9K8_9BACT|nr:pitrilysin family protein [Nitritalea halalkaliphila]EIM78510.1 peptidase M16 domain-containing protein [Nitritalea halalkaliphila LW7]
MPTPGIEAVKLAVLAAVPGDASSPHLNRLSAYFTLKMLSEGTHQHSGEQLDQFFDFHASEVEHIQGLEQIGLSLLSTKKHFASVLPVFRSLFTEANFPEERLDKLKKQKQLSLKLRFQRNNQWASQRFRSLLFGPEHPYGEISTTEDVDAITREDCVTFFREQLWAEPVLYLSGQFDEVSLRQILATFGDLPVRAAEPIGQKFPMHFPEKVYEAREEALQSSIRIGTHLMPKAHPDYLPFYVFNVFLGGYFGSRLIKNIREDKGLTYGIYSSIGSLKHQEYWMLMADVEKSQLQLALREIYLEIERMLEEPLPEDEVEVVRNYLAGSFLSKFSNAFDLMEHFKAVDKQGLDMRFYEAQLQYVKDFQPADIQAVAKKYLQLPRLLEVVVG